MHTMKKIFLLLLLTVPSVMLFAGKIDWDLLKKISGTKWELTGEKKYNKLFPKKNASFAKETITFSNGTILFDLPDEHYACDYTLKNKLELWLYCAQPDQYIYRIHSLNNRELVMDLLIKNKKGKLVRQRRLTYHSIPI